jgi:hypothetical protein
MLLVMILRCSRNQPLPLNIHHVGREGRHRAERTPRHSVVSPGLLAEDAEISPENVPVPRCRFGIEQAMMPFGMFAATGSDHDRTALLSRNARNGPAMGLDGASARAFPAHAIPRTGRPAPCAISANSGHRRDDDTRRDALASDEPGLARGPDARAARRSRRVRKGS